MLDLGWPEMLVIAIVLIVIVGPKDLPKMLRAFGRTTSKVRAMAGEFRKQFDDALKEAELDEFKNLANDARKLNPAAELKKAMSPMEKAARDVKSGLDQAMNPAPRPSTDTASEETTASETAAAAPQPAAKPSSRPLPEPAGAKRAQATAAAAATARTKVAAAPQAADAPKPAAASRPKATKPATAPKKTPSKTSGVTSKPKTAKAVASAAEDKS
jgi:sec-independent protein translocase protein TatB